MSRKEEDVLNYKKIKRNPNQKIIIRKEIIESAERSKKFETKSNKTMGRERGTEAVQKISDGKPVIETLCEKETTDHSCDDSSHSVKEEEMSFLMAFKNNEASAAMTLLDLHQPLDQPQEEPLDLSNNKTLLKKIQRSKASSVLEVYKSGERLLKKPIRISSDMDKNLRAVQTSTTTGGTFGAHKLRLFYEARSKTNPYPVTIPSKVHIPGIGLVPGIFVPGFPARICKGDDCLEISLTDPSEGEEQDHPFLYSTLTKQTTASGYEGYQHLVLSATASSHAFTPPSPDGSDPYMTSAFFDSGQAFIPLTESDCYRPVTPSTPDISQLSTDNRPFAAFAQPSIPLTPDGHQPDRTDIAVPISRCTEPLSAESSKQQSSIFHTEEDSQWPVNMDTGNSKCLPNIPCLYDNVNEWDQPEHEAVKKLLKKKLRGRTEAPH